jgi:hypothetical protein
MEVGSGGIWGLEGVSEEDMGLLVNMWAQLDRPVVQLLAMLPGYMDCVTMWAEKCQQDLQNVSFQSLGGEWPFVYVHTELRLLLTVYNESF